MDNLYLALIQSDRVSDRTRDVLLKRAQPTDVSYEPRVISGLAYSVLKVVVDLLIPQQGGEDVIALAALLDHQKSTGTGDGWRYSSMPPDAVALLLGLEEIQQTSQSKYACAFLDLDRLRQIALLEAIQKGEIEWPRVNASRWFEDLLADLTEIYVSHPSTLAAMGFSGFAFLPGWSNVGLDTAQAWEPVGISWERRRP